MNTILELLWMKKKKKSLVFPPKTFPQNVLVIFRKRLFSKFLLYFFSFHMNLFPLETRGKLVKYHKMIFLKWWSNLQTFRNTNSYMSILVKLHQIWFISKYLSKKMEFIEPVKFTRQSQVKRSKFNSSLHSAAEISGHVATNLTK